MLGTWTQVLMLVQWVLYMLSQNVVFTYVTHALKRNLTHDTAWMHLDDTMLSETRQSRRLVTISDQIHREKSRMVASGARGSAMGFRFRQWWSLGDGYGCTPMWMYWRTWDCMYKMAKMGSFMKNFLITILKNQQNMAGYKVIAYLVLAWKFP